MISFPRDELEEMVERWIDANKEAEEKGDWSILSTFYTLDAEYTWNMGPNQEFRAKGRQDIADVALGYHMKGFEEWKYPYQDVFIDEKKGTVICFYQQIGPGRRPDGSLYQVDGVSGSRFDYGGNGQWKRQLDFFDLGNVKALFFEMAGDGVLSTEIKHKIRQNAIGGGSMLPGVTQLRPNRRFWSKVKDVVAMLVIALFGR